MNARARLEAFRPVKKLKDLQMDKTYQIDVLRHVSTTFGEKVVIECTEKDETFTAFLPKRISDDIMADPNYLPELVTKAARGKLFMKYLGGKYHNMEFTEKEN